MVKGDGNGNGSGGYVRVLGTIISASSLFNFPNKPANPIVIQEASTLDQGCVAGHQVGIGFKHAALLHTLKQNSRHSLKVSASRPLSLLGAV